MTNHNKTLHIIAGTSAGDSLNKMLVEQNMTAAHEVLTFWDDLSIGPLFTSVSDAGLKPRLDYLKKIHQGESMDDEDYYQSIAQQIRDFHGFPFDDYATIVVWQSWATNEVILFDWVCDLCKDYQGELTEINLRRQLETERNRYGLVKYSPKNLADFYQKYRRPVKPFQRRDGMRRWKSGQQSSSLLRLRHGAVAETFFDNLILSLCTTDGQKANRVLGETQRRIDEYPVDIFFIAYRVRTLIEQGQLLSDSKENIGLLRGIRVKLPAEIVREKVLHVVFGDSAAGALRHVLALQGLAQSQSVVALFDDFSVGRLPPDLSTESLQKREDWWQKQYCGGEGYVNDMQDFLNTPFADYDKVVVWHGATVQDQLLLFLMHSIYNEQLHEVVITGKMYDGVGLTLGVLSPLEMVPLLATVTPISAESAQHYREQWQTWCQSPSKLRIMQDEQITAVAEDHFDDFILSKCGTEWQSAISVVGHSMGTCRQYVGDGFITGRLQHLVAIGKVQAKGNTDILREFQVKLPENAQQSQNP